MKPLVLYVIDNRTDTDFSLAPDSWFNITRSSKSRTEHEALAVIFVVDYHQVISRFQRDKQAASFRSS